MTTLNPSAPSSTAEKAPSKALNVGLWVAQVALGAMFGMGGLMKATAPIADLAQKLVWPGAVPELMVRFIGTAELLGGLGLLLPSLTRIKPRLTPLAALGLATIMLLALVFHITRGELQALPINLGLGAIAAFIAWGRGKAAPIAAR
jgi:uncharacterized membrane protein YphA (DoxX/SURF4 family)